VECSSVACEPQLVAEDGGLEVPVIDAAAD